MDTSDNDETTNGMTVTQSATDLQADIVKAMTAIVRDTPAVVTAPVAEKVVDYPYLQLPLSSGLRTRVYFDGGVPKTTDIETLIASLESVIKPLAPRVKTGQAYDDSYADEIIPTQPKRAARAEQTVMGWEKEFSRQAAQRRALATQQRGKKRQPNTPRKEVETVANKAALPVYAYRVREYMYDQWTRGKTFDRDETFTALGDISMDNIERTFYRSLRSGHIERTRNKRYKVIAPNALVF